MAALAAKEREGKVMIEAYQRLEKSQEDLEHQTTQLRAQLLENTAVKEELALLEDDAEVFKSMGPVLVKLELSDAKATVKQRLDRLESEILRLGDAFKAKEEEKKTLAGKITVLQSEVRALGGKASGSEE